jgi:hypothetical protein
VAYETIELWRDILEEFARFGLIAAETHRRHAIDNEEYRSIYRGIPNTHYVSLAARRRRDEKAKVQKKIEREAEFRRRPLRTCLQCGRDITRYRINAKFCGRKCKCQNRRRKCRASES